MIMLMQCKSNYASVTPRVLHDWWTPFVNKLIVPRLASRFIAISVVLLNEGYNVFHMLITRWKPVMSPESMMKKVLKCFM